MPNHSDSPLHRRVLIAAFEGWSDAGSATTTVLQHLGGLLRAEVLHAIGAEGFVDYQVHRPRVSFTDSGDRVLEWPETRLYGFVQRPGTPETAEETGAPTHPTSHVSAADPQPESHAAPGAHTATASHAVAPTQEQSIEQTNEQAETLPGAPESAHASAQPGTRAESSQTETVRRINGTPVTDLYLLAGVEPSRDWMSYADEIIDLVETWGFDTVIILGSLFSDAPHSRPIAISVHSDSAAIRASTGATRSDYSGPVGITSVLDIALATAGVNVLTLWAQVPHYVHSAPSPKATLALLDRLEELLDVVIPRGELLSEATEWEANIDRIAAADEDMARYIRALEAARDATNAPEATGEAIAHEFEKFLNPQGGRPSSPHTSVSGDHPSTDPGATPPTDSPTVGTASVDNAIADDATTDGTTTDDSTATGAAAQSSQTTPGIGEEDHSDAFTETGTDAGDENTAPERG